MESVEQITVGPSAERWRKIGEQSGRDDARNVHNEEDEPDLNMWRSLSSGVEEHRHVAWDEDARNADAAGSMKVPAEFHAAYYEGYAAGGLAEAWAIRRELEAREAE